MHREIRIFLFRHGQTDWNAQERFQGHVDVPLNETGRAQARELGASLQAVGLDAILTSDLSRAYETARIVAEAIGLESTRVFPHGDLKEAFLGLAQGLTIEEIRARFGVELTDRWRSNRVTDADISYPGGETAAEVLVRALRAVRDFASAHPDFNRIGLSTHGGVIRRMMHFIASRAVPIPNGVVYEVLYEPGTDRWSLGSLPESEAEAGQDGQKK